ncbi:MAG TPA: TRAP transporter substrate-binding protein [Kiloniellales bacterium]|nr:TRAP transporter substrate-binding protein [Kiloniellales bacterium]
MRWQLRAGLLAAALGTALAGAASATESWDMPTPYPENNFHTRNIEEFARQVRATTGGSMSDTIEITVHPNQSLVKHGEIKNAVRSGQVQLGEFLLSTLSNENAIFGVDSVPFLATGYDASWKLWQASKPKVEALLAEQGLVVLFAVAWPPQGIYTNKEITKVEDLAGLKFRTYNAATERLAQLAGAVPTQIEASDIAQAFATGRVEAMVTSSSTGANSKAWDFLKYYYDTQAWLPKNIVVINKEVFDALEPAKRESILAAAKQAEERGWKMSQEENGAQKKALSDNGMQVVTPSEALQSGLKAIGETMTAEWTSQAGADGQAILVAFKM